jgi:hypothetical protein
MNDERREVVTAVSVLVFCVFIYVFAVWIMASLEADLDEQQRRVKQPHDSYPEARQAFDPDELYPDWRESGKDD